MKKFYTFLITLFVSLSASAAEVHGWPGNYGGVMLQGFSWDDYSSSKWKRLESQAFDLGQYFNLVWLPQSGNCGGSSMGYDPLYWFPGEERYTSSFGTEAELRSLISTFRDNGIGTIADVVVNHRKNVSNWVDFPAETYKGVTYQLQSTDICRNDDGGATLTWANANGYSLSNTDDEGEGWDGMRDLDHTSSNVQKNVKAYTKMLVDDLGYIGFRYDMVKGFAGYYTGMYNTHAGVEYSVGECWDGTQCIRNWIDNTKVDGWPTSAAFDFQFKYVVNNAANNGNWANLTNNNGYWYEYPNWPLAYKNYDSGNYRRWAVTFVENHDTQVRPDGKSNGPLTKDTLAANAYMMAMPGTPCVFMKHWLDCKQDIKKMIDVRRAAGIHNQSDYIHAATKNDYVVLWSGETGNYTLITVVGKSANSITPSGVANYVKVVSGYHYAYYLKKTLETTWTDLPSGDYGEAQTTTVTAVSTDASAKLVYTTNGSNPTASSTQVANGGKINIPVGTTTLKVGLLSGGTVKGIATRNYNIVEPEPFTPHNITVYVNADAPGWNSYVNFHSWGDYRTGTSWPGDKVTATTTINGKKWYYKSYALTRAEDAVNFVFSIGTSANANQNQTSDIVGVDKDSYFEISATKSSQTGKFTATNVTDVITGIGAVRTDTNENGAVYDLQGRKMPSDCTLSKGIYIRNGKKVVIR